MKKKLRDMKQVDGKLDTFRATTLDQIWGDTGTGKYKTMDETVYAEQLRDMNLSDLQSHAIKVGFPPSSERERLIKRLIQEFRLHVANYSSNASPIKDAVKPSKELEKILSEGR